MRKKIWAILQLTVFLLIIGCKFVFSADSSIKVLDKKNILIFELDDRKAENHYKAIYETNSSLADFKQMVLNPENHKKWIGNVKSAINIGEKNDSVIYTHIVISVKSILKKEAVVKTTIKTSLDTNTYITQKIDTTLKFNSQYKKLNIFTAEWKIKELKEGKLKIELSFIGEREDYPDFIDDFLRSIFIKKLYKLAYRSRKQANEMN
jgi:hypothetical protein